MSPKDEVIANRKDQILQCAAALFADQGYYKTTTAHVASAAGVTQPYVFHFFKSKEQLYLTVLEHAFERMRLAFSTVDAPPAELSHRMGSAFNDLMATHRSEMLLLMQCFTTPEPEVRQFSRDKFSLIYDTIKARYEQAGIPNPAHETSMFISCGMIITLAEVLSLPKLIPWGDIR
ncbi:TetR/AcrR family transcriptional regulator [Cohnella yongneupensis]|uniref:TetR/AcrR family transcriptional regulator n=1 Tax=Cohnella yongneupensis TaxID=425006 RepID=A0ABW0R526_9BACL